MGFHSGFKGLMGNNFLIFFQIFVLKIFVEAARSLSDTLHSVRPLWMSDWPAAETYA